MTIYYNSSLNLKNLDFFLNSYKNFQTIYDVKILRIFADNSGQICQQMSTKFFLKFLKNSEKKLWSGVFYC